MKKLNFGSAFVAGLVATGAMTLLMYAAPLLGLPKMDILRALGSLVPWQGSPYLPGILLHFGIGSSLAVFYALFFARLLPGPRWARGALYSLLPWLFAIVAMGPLMALVQSWTAPALAGQAMNPCAVVNPCAAGARPANPCAIRPQAANPCASAGTAAAPQALNPCSAVAGPGQTAPSPWLLRLLSLVNHLVYGALLGLLYRPRVTAPAAAARVA
ncbi:MAG: hypothetical protein KatS3mg131_1754 [Candidatus Tectimicrobiota bacterium]|nr:MAG: hypothetical protein KatS3mg131_1754 [Candidatus Tectomicrobia bacterium]